MGRRLRPGSRGLGFKALASTSSGFAFTLGRLDGKTTLADVAEHAATLDGATELPVSVDLENGYGAEPESAARAVTSVAEAGAVGGSIEDYDPGGRLYELEQAAERVAAAAEAARALSFPFTLTARAENHIRGNPDLDGHDRAAARVRPGRRRRALCARASNRGRDPYGVRCRLEAGERAGARRPLARGDRGCRRAARSVGGGLTWVAVGAMAAAATAIRDRGDFSALTARPPIQEWLG